MLILLWGLETEGPLAAVNRELHRLGIPTIFVDQSDPSATEIDLTVAADVTGWIFTRGQRTDLAAVTAAYLRPYDSRSLYSAGDPDTDDQTAARGRLVDDILSAWSQITPGLIVNRFDAMAANSSKPYQLQLIRNFGFKVPATLVTTDPGAAEEFWQRYQTVIYKSVSGTRSRVSRLHPEHRGRLLDVAACPTQFQQYIPGRDHRVHVIGTEVFASELICDADDYRYPEQHRVEIRKCIIPVEVEDRCRALAGAMQLPLAGVDLRRTPEGDWYCFEVNPSPAFTYYEQATGQPMAHAIARLLASGGNDAMDAALPVASTGPAHMLLTSAGFIQPVAWNT